MLISNRHYFKFLSVGSDFNNENVLRDYINVQLNNQTLFLSGQQPNVINIIILKQNDKKNSEISNEEPFDNTVGENENKFDKKSDKVQEESNSTEIQVEKAKTYNANLKSNGNQISWNSELSKAQSLIISFKSLEDGNLLVEENVTGQSGFYFTYSNSIYTDSRIKIELKAVFSDNSKIKNQTLTVNNLTCH